MKRPNKEEDVSDMVVHFDRDEKSDWLVHTEINEELIVENQEVLYDFSKEIDQYFITKEMLREYMHNREWRTAEDFDLKEFLRFYQGMVKNAASK